MESFKKMLNDRIGIPSLSPAWETGLPDRMVIRDAKAYARLFTGLIMRRSPARVGQRGLFQSFLSRSSLLKLEHDLLQGFDISVVPYHVRLDLKAWGLVLHPTGRILEILQRDDGMLELAYQGGCLRSKQDWRRLAGKRTPDEADNIRRFYNQVRMLAAGRVVLAGTVGFGLWDALWMSFDFERACAMLRGEEEFARSVFEHWFKFHCEAVAAMLDAGIKLIVFREHPRGFRPEGMAARLDAFLGDHFGELTRMIRSRGGCSLMDCDEDEIFETDFPSQWGFDGIGPLRFRDMDDLLAARRCLNEELLLVGTVADNESQVPSSGAVASTQGLIVTNRSRSSTRTQVLDADVPSPVRDGLRLAS